MIIRSRAPLRIGLAGGGSDVSPFCDIYGGEVINATINKYVYCVIDTSRDNNIRFTSRDMGRVCYLNVKGLDADRLEGILPLHAAVYDYFVKNGFLDKKLTFSLTTWTDVPYGSGLGASSSIVVAMIAAYNRLLNTDFTSRKIVEVAIEIERDILGLPGGKQDQCAATYGGFINHLKFENRQFEIEKLHVSERIINELEMSMLLCYSHPFRNSEDTMLEQIKRVKDCDEESIIATKKIVSYVADVRRALIDGSIETVAEIITNSYLEKAKIATRVVTPVIAKMRFDFMRLSPPALAVKICGAGSGGFLLLIVDPLYKKKIQKIAPYDNHLWMEFQFVYQGVQSWKL